MEYTPFLTIFPDCRDLHDLAGGLEKSHITRVKVHAAEARMEIEAKFAAMPSPVEQKQLEDRIALLYGLKSVKLDPDYPRTEIQKSGTEFSGTAAAGPNVPAGDVLMGRSIRQQPVSMDTLTLESGRVTVEGDVFAVSSRQLQKRGGAVLSFDITDHTNSIRVTRFLRSDEDQSVLDRIAEGSHLTVQGEIGYSKFDDDMVLEPKNIVKSKKKL